MRQAIETKFLPPTNNPNRRIVAKAWAGKIIIRWDNSLNHEQNHIAAARALADKYGWEGELIGGGNVDCSGFYFVFKE